MPSVSEVVTNPDVIIGALREVCSYLRKNERSRLFSPQTVEVTQANGTSVQKEATHADVAAQDIFFRHLRERVASDCGVKALELLLCIGEENLASFKVHGSEICILADIIDGTHLYRAGIEYCSAIVVFAPIQHRILGAYVALWPPHMDAFPFYYALDTDSSAHFRIFTATENGSDEPIKRGMDDTNPIIILSLTNLRMLQESSTYLELIAALEKKGAYTISFGVNPLGPRLALGAVGTIVKITPSFLHDFVPGLYIAVKSDSNVVFGDLDGRVLSVDSLSRRLLKPYLKGDPYILAGDMQTFVAISEVTREITKKYWR